MADQTDHNLSVLRGLLDQVSGDVPVGLESMARKALTELEQAAHLRAPKGDQRRSRDGEPSDEPTAFARWIRDWYSREPTGEPPHSEAFAAGYQAGRAPKGELEEARAELGAFLYANYGRYVNHSGPVVGGRWHEEMAEGWACDTGCLCNMHKDDLVEALRTAAREAQLRVLEAYAKEARALDGDLLFTLRSRIDSGEDL